MRLLHSKTYELRPEYAILSHTWDEEEVTFQDMQSWLVKHTFKPGWKKIMLCCKQAQKDGLNWIWIDTCCIDKSSSADLSEAINSMFSWYRRAKIWYAYLADLSAATWSAYGFLCLKESRWFGRGWTLQNGTSLERGRS